MIQRPNIRVQRNLLSLLSPASLADINLQAGAPFHGRQEMPFSYADFLGNVAAWRSLLQHQKGTKFALYLSDTFDFSCALLGAWQADKTIYLSGDALPATCRNLSAEVDGFLGEFPAHYSPLNLPSDAAPFSAENSLQQYQFKILSETFPCVVIYTSGSTGAPQAVPKKISQLASEVQTLEVLFGSQIGDADILATVSHQHIYGLLFKVLWPLTTGRVIHTRQVDYLESLLPIIAKRNIVLIASPAHLKRLPASFDQIGELQNLRSIFSSGGALTAETAQQVGRIFGKMPIEVYGSSETGGIASRQRQFNQSEALNVMSNEDSWQVMPTIAWRVNQENDVLEINSPHLPDASWHTLADQVEPVDAQRFLLKGRIDRIVKVEEKRISLDAIERALQDDSLVEQARVLLLDVADAALLKMNIHRQKIVAFVVLNDDGRALLARQGKLGLNRRLRDQLTAVIERTALPRSWHYLEALPMNAQGKTTRAALLELLQSNSMQTNTANQTRPIDERVVEHDSENRRVLLALTVPGDLLYFDGHFDGAPILPGVVQVDWALSYGRKYFSLPPHFIGMQALKFQRVITPGMSFQLELQHQVEKSALTFTLTSKEGKHASGRLMFAEIRSERHGGETHV
ncbi:AMP-binding protein [Glaciimonas soli]|uniref:AMP-binding protein n=1 Tax=Glaciimonas soli TaxID=2590999 RepID=A0A843YK58_9BURK|nr:AMP-binding protein [Glaciimonas soli]MQQ99349.1 AMP-binding protein [Glaciimonas soli]